jgi:nitroimidazol reductase NimA-like FMN-containing flavoprotein (pyridoxamine 5'-phosphate oxidase superfamily)
MPAQELDSEEAIDVLANEHLVRVAFHDGESISAKNPSVGFQVDTSCTTGLFAWASITGTGLFEVVISPEERKQAMAALQPVIAEAPEWWQKEQAPRVASGALQVWRIVPKILDGRRYAPADDADRG